MKTIFIKYKYLFYYFIFFTIVSILYFNVQDGKFTNDTLFYLEAIQEQGFKGIANSYNMIFLWQLPSLLYYILYKLFGLHWFGWHLVFSALHALNALLLCFWLQLHTNKKYQGLIFSAALLFLVSPYQTEVVAWGATLHYLTILLGLFVSLISLYYFNTKTNNKWSIGIIIGVIISLWSFEQTYFFIPLFVLYQILFFKNHSKFIKYIFLPILFIVALYFIFTKLSFGVWIAHYDSAVHLKINMLQIFNSLANYLLKFIFFYRDIPFEKIKHLLNNPIVKIGLVVSFFFNLIYLFIYRYKKSINLLILFLGLAFLISILPVLNLDNSFTFEIQSDRYGYVSSIFIVAFLVLTIYKWFKKYTCLVILPIILLSILLTFKNNFVWKNAGIACKQLALNYPLDATKHVWILNLPDNYKGAYVYRNSFAEALKLYHNNKHYNRNTINILASPNVLSLENETKVININDSTLQINCIGYGKWYYYKSQGATDYQTENYHVDFDEWNTGYSLIYFPSTIKDTTYILQCYGTNWKIIDTILPTKE